MIFHMLEHIDSEHEVERRMVVAKKVSVVESKRTALACLCDTNSISADIVTDELADTVELLTKRIKDFTGATTYLNNRRRVDTVIGQKMLDLLCFPLRVLRVPGWMTR